LIFVVNPFLVNTMIRKGGKPMFKLDIPIKQAKALERALKEEGWIIVFKKGEYHHYCCRECSSDT